MPFQPIQTAPLPWVNFPPTSPLLTMQESEGLIRQCCWMIQDKERALGNLRWPRHNIVWNEHTDLDTGAPISGDEVDSVVANSDGSMTVTCGGANWIATGRNPWVSSPAAPSAIWIPDGPSSYDVIIEVNGPDDHVKIVRAMVLDRLSATTVKITSLRDYVTGNYLESLEEIASDDGSGPKIFFIKRGGIWHHERWPAFPQGEEIARFEVTASTNKSIKSQFERWDVNQFKAAEPHMGPADPETNLRGPNPSGGFEIMCIGTDGYMHRIKIAPQDHDDDDTTPDVANILNEIYFDSLPHDGGDDGTSAWTPMIGEDAVVIRAGQRFMFDREIHQPWRWYSGARDFVWGFSPNVGNSGPAGHLEKSMRPAVSVDWFEYDFDLGECILKPHAPAVDEDMWSDDSLEVAMCGGWQKADKCYSPHVFKTWRAIQWYLIRNAGRWIEPLRGDVPQKGLPWMAAAQVFRRAGINALRTTITAYADGVATLGSTWAIPQYFPIAVHFAVHKYDSEGNFAGQNYYGTTQMPSADSIQLPGLPTSDTDAGYAVGSKIDISLGFDRFPPRHFPDMYQRIYWKADMDPRPPDDGGTGELVEPPRTFVPFADYHEVGSGTWNIRPIRETYTPESGELLGTGDPFEIDQIAQFTGENWNDPIWGGEATSFLLPPDIKFFAHVQNAMIHPSLAYNTRDNQLSGYGTDGSTTRITDSSRDWFRHIWHAGGGAGYGHRFAGTCSSGSATTFTDSSVNVNSTAGAWWAAARFVGFASAYHNFPIRFLLPTKIVAADGNETIEDRWHYRILETTGTNEGGGGGGVHGSWTDPLKTPAGGNVSTLVNVPYEVVEPEYELHRWQGRRVLVTRASDKTTHESWIKFNTPQDLFISPALPFAFGRGDTYQIEDVQPGGVFVRKDAKPTDRRLYVKQAEGKYWWSCRDADQDRTGINPQAPQNFHIDEHENETGYVRRFGMIERWDQIRHWKLYDQIRKYANILRDIKWPVFFSSRGADLTVPPPATPGHPANHFNYIESTGSIGSNWAEWKADAEAGWGGEGTEEGGNPFARASTSYSPPSFSTAVKERRSGYAKMENIPHIYKSSADLWLLTKGPGKDSSFDEGADPPDLAMIYFEALGDPVTEDLFQKWNTGTFGAESDSVNRVSELVGGNSIPAGWPGATAINDFSGVGEPRVFNDGLYASSVVTGWDTVTKWGVLRFDGAGGLKMLDALPADPDPP